MVITSKLVRGEREPLNEKPLEDVDDPKEEVEAQHVTQDDPAVPDLGQNTENP